MIYIFFLEINCTENYIVAHFAAFVLTEGKAPKAQHYYFFLVTKVSPSIDHVLH
jgi:hypothetical protein